MNISKVFSVFLRNFHPSTEKSEILPQKAIHPAKKRQTTEQKPKPQKRAQVRKKPAPKKGAHPKRARAEKNQEKTTSHRKAPPRIKPNSSFIILNATLSIEVQQINEKVF